MESLGIDPRAILISAVGFLILMTVLIKFAFGPLFKMLEARQTHIQGNIDEAQARRDEMVRLQRDYEDRLAKIEDEARDKIQAAVKDAQAARDEIIAKAKADSAAIFARGQEEIEQERRKALIEMRDQVADLAIGAASRVVKTNLDSANHARLIDDVIAGLGAESSTRLSNGSTNGSAN